MQDPDLEEALGIVGHVIGSHVMCRATISVGPGRHEEILTADLADLFRNFDVMNDYLLSKGSRSRMQVSVSELTKPQEAVVGADFQLALAGQDGSASVYKLFGIQAKRLAYGSLSYAPAKNYIRHAENLVEHYGKESAFFAFYHDTTVFNLPMTKPRSTWNPPSMYFMEPTQGKTYFGKPNPSFSSPVFIEPSSYRHLYMMQKSLRSLPECYGWGVGMLDAAHLVQSQAAPSVQEVLTYGTALHRWLVAAAECSVGKTLADAQELKKRFSVTVPGFHPSFRVLIQFADARNADRWNWIDDRDKLVNQ